MKKQLALCLYSFLLLSGNLLAQPATVTLDYFFNNEYKKNAAGVPERFHYTWEDKSINGYSIWADSFRAKNALVKSLPVAPTAASLKGTDIYIIADPDTDKETTTPNLMTATHAANIAAWVKQLALCLYSFLLLSGNLLAQPATITLDYFFNNEYKKDAAGVPERFHYTWEDKSINGYSIWADSFRAKNALVKSLPVAPTAASLKGTDIYIIADPDTDKETTTPNLMTATHAAAIAAWVKQGGVLVMMVNDSANAELHQFNLLADQFGIHFTDKVRNSVLKDISVGKIMVPAQHPIFQKGKQLYLKGICTIALQPNAQAVLEDKGDVIMATARYGKGTVFAVTDPWIYNEYIVNDRLNPDFQNAIAAGEFSSWLLKQVPARR